MDNKQTVTASEKALEEFKQISDVLSVPAIGKELPDKRRWKLPCPDKKALADHPSVPIEIQIDKEVKNCLDLNSAASTQVPQASEPSSVQSSAGDFVKQTGRK